MHFKKFYKDNVQPYIIAEIGVNHNCNIKIAKKQIDLAKKGGASAVKFQTYKANLIASKFSPSYWDLNEEKTNSQFKLFSRYDKFDQKDYINLSNYCKKKKIDFITTPFDIDCVGYLKKIVSSFKIASSDITNFPLIKKVAKCNLPMIISTGAANMSEIKETVRFIRKFNSKELIIMHCILSYPTQNKDANLMMIDDLKKKFPNELIGYSDHTKPDKHMLVTKNAFVLGAKVIEKHFTHNKKLRGNDHYHSMDFKDLKNFRKETKRLLSILGMSKKKPVKVEFNSRKYARRSIVLTKSLKKGSKLKHTDLIIKRPGTGILPKFLNKVIGKKINKILREDHILKWTDISKK